MAIDTFVWLICFGIAVNFLWGWLAGLLAVIFFFALFPVAWGQAEEKVNPSDKKTKGSSTSKKNESDYSGITFTVTTSYGDYEKEDYEEVKKSNWIGNGKSIEIQGYSIQNPNIYVYDSGRKSPACHIVPTKLKATKKENYDEIGYWPSYSDLNPGQRGMFLNWLATGKNDSKIDIGYVFIYFYGLEYRVLKENKDYKSIAQEIIRLRKIYSSNNSFKNYSEGLLAYILSNLSDKDFASEIFTQIQPTLDKYSYIYRSGINLKIKKSVKLTEDELISAISSFENVQRSSIPSKVGNYFDQYFKIIAKNEISDAISSIEPKEYNERYYSASNFLRDEHTYKGLRIIVDRKTQNILAKKWTEAIDAFRPYSRKLSKNAPKDIFNLLPFELRQIIDHPNKENLKKIESNFLDKVIDLKNITDSLGINIGDKVNQKDAKEIVESLLSSNIIIEPNLSYFKKTYRPDDNVILTRTNNASMLDGDDYKLAALMADFGADLAHSDNDYSKDEAEQIYNLISSDFLSKEIEKEHLKLRVKLYENSKPKMNGVFKKLSEKLDLKDLKIFSNYLVKVALADGVLSKEEDRKIRDSLAKLGLESSYIEDLYSSFDVDVQFDNVELRRPGSPTSTGSAIPKKVDGISIDRAKLSKLAADTAEVKSVLSEIITLEEKEADYLDVPEDDSASEIVLSGKYKELLEVILSKKEWEKNELKEKAKEFGLMINAAISKINEWTDEKYGDFLIYEDEFYHIQTDIITEEKNCA